MQEKTKQMLLDLNRRFYQTFASHFSNTRMRLQPGVEKSIDTLPKQATILDLGCGNGNLAQALVHRSFCGDYLGLDSSFELLEIARRNLQDFKYFSFLHGDIADLDWDTRVLKNTAVLRDNKGLDVVLSFAVFHHLPGRDLHHQTFKKIHTLLPTNGRLIFSNWQFLNSERLRKRIQDWELIGLTPDELEPGDYLLDWRQGGRGLRYVHHFSPEELNILAELSGFEIIESFLSDGENGKLGLYQIWEKV